MTSRLALILAASLLTGCAIRGAQRPYTRAEFDHWKRAGCLGEHIATGNGSPVLEFHVIREPSMAERIGRYWIEF